jgi:uncharacterized protein (DUF169 family)
MRFVLSEKAKDVFEKLAMEYPAVCLKYHVVRPKNIPQYAGEKLAFCQYLKHAQLNKGTFYIEESDDACYGKMSLGMIPFPPVTASGQAGYDFEMFRSSIVNQQLYQKLPVLVPGTVNYVQFVQVSDCDFSPDLMVCVAGMLQSDILMRATSYISGDLWESKSSPVISCAWMYAYPIISGKVNHITTGYYHGLKRRKAYPAGLRMIAIPFQKIDEVVTALQEMPWTPIAFREDEESKAELKRRMNGWQEMAKELDCTVDLR